MLIIVLIIIIRIWRYTVMLHHWSYGVKSSVKVGTRYMNFKILKLILQLTDHQGNQEWINVISVKTLMAEFDMSTRTGTVCFNEQRDWQRYQFDSHSSHLLCKSAKGKYYFRAYMLWIYHTVYTCSHSLLLLYEACIILMFFEKQFLHSVGSKNPLSS